MGKFRKSFLIALAIILITLFILVPLLWIVMLSFKTNNEIVNSPLSIPNMTNIANFVDAWNTVEIPRFFANTILLAIVVVFFELLLSVPCSYAIARFRLKDKKTQNLIYAVFISGLVIPIFILIFPIYTITTMLNLQNTYLALAIPYIAGSIPLNTLLLVGGFKAFPAEIEEAAIIDGAGLFTIILRMLVPVAKPVIATLLVFNFLGVWNEFPLASILINKSEMWTIALSISKFRGLYDINYAATAAYIIIIIIPQLIFYSYFQKYIIAGMTAGAVKG